MKLANSHFEFAPYTERVSEAAGRDDDGTQSVQECSLVHNTTKHREREKFLMFNLQIICHVYL